MAGCSENDPATPSFDDGRPLVVQYVLGGPAAGILRDVSAVAADPSGDVYVYDRGVIYRYGADGILADTWPVDVPNKPRPYAGNLGGLETQVFYQTFRSLVISGNSLFVSGNEWVLRYDREGNLLGSWEIPRPEGQSRAEVQDLAVDSPGNLYVLDAGGRRVLKYAPAGQLLGQWGSRGTHDGELETPVALAVDPAGTAYISDIERKVIQAYDLDGNFLRAWGFRPDEQGLVVAPFRLTVDSEGRLLSLGREEGRKRRIQKFSSEGELLAQWFATPPEAGPYRSDLIGLAAEPSGNVLVLDRARNRIHRFSPSGAFLRTIGEPVSPEGVLHNPFDGDTDAFGNVYILSFMPPGVSQNEVQIVKYSATGQFLGNIGDETSGIEYPRLLAAGTGHLFVLDNDRVLHVLDPDGRPIRKWDLADPDPDRRTPTDMEVDSRGRLVILHTSGHVREFDPEGFPLFEYQVPRPDDGGFSHDFRSLTTGPRNTRTVRAGSRLISVTDKGAYQFSFDVPSEGLPAVYTLADIAQDRQGDLFLLDSEARRIVRFTRTYSYLSRTLHIEANGRRLLDPSLIFADDFGGVYVLDNHGSQVFKLGSQRALEVGLP